MRFNRGWSSDYCLSIDTEMDFILCKVAGFGFCVWNHANSSERGHPEGFHLGQYGFRIITPRNLLRKSQ